MNKSIIFRAKPYKNQIYHIGEKRYSAITNRLTLNTKVIFLGKFQLETNEKIVPINQSVLKRLFVKNHTLKFHSPKKVSINFKKMWKLWDKRFPITKLNSDYLEKYTLHRLF